MIPRLLILLPLLALNLQSAPPSPPPPLKLLFAGSSSMYWNDLPRAVAGLVDGKIAAHPGRSVVPEAVGRSGSDIRVYLEPGFNRYEYGVKPGQSFLDKIRDEKPDIVAMMVVCRFIMGDDDPQSTGSAHADAVTKYCEAIRAAGGEPMFYEMGWGNTPREAEGRARIFDLAVKNKIQLFAPCSTAWARVYAEKPELALQHPSDQSHPGDAGHFLNLACFYAALTGESPVGKLPRTFAVWPHGKYPADESKLAAFQPDAYQAKMAKWMFKHMSMKQTATLDDATARYLESVAWETWRDVSTRLQASKKTASTTAAPAVPRLDFHAFLDTHCLDCHDSDAKKGDLDLSGFINEDAVMHDRAIWRSVYEKIESHQMPPPKQKSQPSDAQRQELMAWIMDIAAQPDPVLGAPDPGKPELRRLTRLEYNNTVRDLFGLDTDVFIFPERLPISDKSYYQPASGKMGDAVKVPLREYGGKYQVLCRQLGLPGDNRAEHGYRNRGDAMDFSPLLLEQYLAAANEIVSAPELPARSAIFAELIGVDPSKLPPLVKKPLPQGFGDAASVPLASEYVPAIDKPKKPDDSPDWIGDFRRMIAEAHADGCGGVFDVPAALSNQTIAGKGGLIKATFGSRTFTINPNADLWLVSFATAEEASGPALLTNKEKGAKVFELTFDIRSDNEDEGIERLGVCVLGRNKQSGEVKLTAVFTDATETPISANIAEGAAGTTFVSFAAHPGETIKKLIVDGSQFSGDYVLLDDIGIITNGVKQTLLSVQDQAKPEKQKKQKKVSVSRPPHERLAAFIERAFRRTVTEEEVTRFHALYEAERKTKPESEAMKTAVAAVLASPSFLYIEANGVPESSKVAPLEDAELATRLAYFLWASTPDDELLQLAKVGKLHEPAVLESQALRLLRDGKSRELSESFAVQWLRLDQLYTSKPDRDLFQSFYSGPQGKATLHGSAMVEALLLFETVLAEDRSILDFISPDYTWLNPGLAKLYDIPFGEEAVVTASAGDGNRELKKKNDLGSQWRRVKLADANRGGFMAMSAPMVVTSLPFRTSPVKRGAWLLETIFNRPPTEPKVAFAIENDTKEAAQQMSIREKFEAHRSKAACYSCHIRLDPPGFALQRFDPVGAWDAGADAKSEWQGRPFDGPAGFKALLAQDPHEFTRGFIEHLLSYAINRPLEIYDMPTVEKIEQSAKAHGWRLSRVIVEIVKSYPFTHVHNAP